MSEKFPNSLEREETLVFGHLAPEVWKALAELPRSGWVKRGVKNPESVKEHTLALCTLARTVEGLAERETEELVQMLEVHDWPEAIDGDPIILTTEDSYAERKAKKAERERNTMEKICSSLGEVGEQIYALWLRYETSNDSVASLARQLDKYQAIEKALEYERAQGTPLFKEFLDHNGPFITHPELIARLRRLYADWET